MNSSELLSLLGPSIMPMTEKKIERRYFRLCRVQNDLGRLDFKKAAPGKNTGSAFGFSLEDFVFSQTDFSPYREIEEKHFEDFFLEGLSDFDDSFFTKNFSLDRGEVKSVIETSYKKNEVLYKIQRENSLILSIMRTLDTSLEETALFTPEEIQAEIEKLQDFAGENIILPEIKTFFPLFVSSLANISVRHNDGMTTKLFVCGEGNLKGTFHPAGKPWTRVLIPCYA